MKTEQEIGKKMEELEEQLKRVDSRENARLDKISQEHHCLTTTPTKQSVDEYRTIIAQMSILTWVLERK